MQTPCVYRKRAVEIEAMQVDGYESTTSDILSWINNNGGDALRGHPGNYVVVTTLEGSMKADIGDYIIRGVKGEFYPCKPDIFQMTYDKV